MTSSTSRAPEVSPEGPTTPARIVPASPDAVPHSHEWYREQGRDAMYEGPAAVAAVLRQYHEQWGEHVDAHTIRTLELNRESAAEGIGTIDTSRAHEAAKKLDAAIAPVASTLATLPTLADAWDEEVTEVPYLVPGILVAGGLAVVGGEPGAGKSWLTKSLALSVATGRPFLDHYPVERPGRVAYISNEGPPADVRLRLKALSLGMGATRSELAGMTEVAGSTAWARLTSDVSPLMDDLRNDGHLFDLIVFDTLAASWAGNESDNQAMQELLTELRTIAQTGPTILLVHHLAKTTEANAKSRPGQRLRGASALHGARDSLLVLTRRGNDRLVHVTVEQRASQNTEFGFSLPDHEVTGAEPVRLEWSEASTSPAASTPTRPRKDHQGAVVQYVTSNPGCTRSEVKRNVKGGNDALWRAASDAVSTGRLREVDGQLYPAENTAPA